MVGAQDRQLARISALIPLLLAGPIKRKAAAQHLIKLLRERGDDGAFGAQEGQSPLACLDRDLKRFKAADWLRFEPGRTYRASPGAGLPLWLSPSEAQAMRLALAVLEQLGLPESDTLTGLLQRVDPVVAGRQGQVPPTVALSLSGVDPLHWATLMQGVEEGRRMILGYQKPNSSEPDEVKLDRARLMWLGQAFYLVAFVPDKLGPKQAPHQALREYRLDRVVSVELLPAKVIHAQLPMMEGEAILSASLNGRIAKLKDAEGHWLQQVHTQADGRLRFQFRAPSLLRAQQCLWSFGHQVEAVLSPPELAQSMAPYLELGRKLRESEELS